MDQEQVLAELCLITAMFNNLLNNIYVQAQRTIYFFLKSLVLLIYSLIVLIN